MAYDYGSHSLGIKNPFRTEGFIYLFAGILITLLAIYPLLTIAQVIQTDVVRAWGQAGLGLIFLIWGINLIAKGGFKLFRFYVGRSTPSSLSYNFAKTEQENANWEYDSKVLAYDSEQLGSMLMGRKNITFKEPLGWLARFIHSVFPRLIFAPYRLRNFLQELASVVVSTLIALFAFGISSFVVVSGLAGQADYVILPILSFILLLYLIVIWARSSKRMVRGSGAQLRSSSIKSLSFLIAFAIVAPIAIGYLYNFFVVSNDGYTQELKELVVFVFSFSAWSNLLLLAVLALIILVPTFLTVRERLAMANPQASVSEYRDNMQENIHPNEIFINIDNIVLANRRYKNIPNRVYREFLPELNAQAQDKGSFEGSLLVETQPAFKAIEFSSIFKKTRLITTIGAQALAVTSALLLYWLFNSAFAGYEVLSSSVLSNLPEEEYLEFVQTLGSVVSSLLFILFAWLSIVFAARVLAQLSHLLWAEMHFESLLLSLSVKGTYTESKISTGMAYNDSTRSENSVVRSSISPWILTSRIVTSTYATSGMMNLEMPRLVLEMHENQDEMDTIVGEIGSFLRGREYIASIDNEKDLANAERIYQVNRVSSGNDSDNLQTRLEDNSESTPLEELPKKVDTAPEEDIGAIVSSQQQTN